MKVRSFGAVMLMFGLIGLGIGVILFFVTQTGFEIPIVIGTTTYTGMRASVLLLIASPIVLLLIGFIATLFTSSAGKK